MAKLNLKTMKKSTKDHIITFAMVIVVYMCVGAFSSAFCTKLLQDSIQNEVVLFLIAIAVGTVAAAFFGFLIGIPVLRLRGDYLAIVTLAFGEIIKNLINILYVGIDDSGLHVATSSAALKLGTGGKRVTCRIWVLYFV